MSFNYSSNSNSSSQPEQIPLLAYGLVGVTSLVLAYATLADNSASTSVEPVASATSLLPTISNPFSSAKPTPLSSPSIFSPATPQPVYGGKGKHKKTISKQQSKKQTKRNNKK